jgi:hypothetical protein
MLGDLVDGQSKKLKMEQRCVAEMLEITLTSLCPWHFVVGNHDLTALSREMFFNRLIPEEMKANCSPTQLYYSTRPHPGFMFLFLDGYEISTISATSLENKGLAEKLICDNNPNCAIPGADWLAGLEGTARRYVVRVFKCMQFSLWKYRTRYNYRTLTASIQRFFSPIGDHASLALQWSRGRKTACVAGEHAKWSGC